MRLSPAAAIFAVVASACLAGCGSSSKPSSGPSPTITSLDPSAGTAAGGTPVVISGTNFASPTVTFGGAAATVVSSTATAIHVTTPLHAAGVVAVVVINGDGHGVTLPAGFNYVAPGADPAPLPVATGVRGLGAFPVARAGLAGAADPFPGWSNVWVLDYDLALFDLQAQLQPAAELWLGTPTGTPTVDSLLDDPGLDRSLVTDFQGAAELTWTGPLDPASTPPAVAASSTFGFGGLTAPWAVLGGTLVTEGGNTSGTRLQQVVNLAGGVGTTAVVLVSWRQQGFLANGRFEGSPAASWKVTLRHPATDAVLTVLDEEPSGSLAAFSGPVGVDPRLLAGLAQVKLTFEVAAASDDSLVTLDDAWLTVDGVGRVVNGDFAAGLSGWTSSSPAAPPRVVGGLRTVGAPLLSGPLQITRSVYVAPDGAWARVTDLFHNPSTQGQVTTTAVSYFALGVGVHGVISAVPATGGKAWSAWDTDGLVGDVAIVHGGATPYLRGVNDLAGFDGSQYAYSTFPLTVPAGQSKAVVHFVVLGQTAANADGLATLGTRATTVEGIAKAIVDGWATSPDYRAYLSAEERAAVVNF